MVDGVACRFLSGVHVTCILFAVILSECQLSSSTIDLSSTNDSTFSSGFRTTNECHPGGKDCKPMERCCRSGERFACCPPPQCRCDGNGETYPVFKNPSADPHWFHRFSLWNMWYFWFIVVLIMATCFTGCNYWRRQRRSRHFRLFQRQYTTIGTRHGDASGGPQIVIPITMYEVSPDTILRLMRDNASYHTTTSTLSSSSGYGSPRFYGHHHHYHSHSHHGERHHERLLHQGPPSYGEVTAKPSMYPPKVDDSEPPSYESVSHTQQREPAGGQGLEDRRAEDPSSQQNRRLSF